MQATVFSVQNKMLKADFCFCKNRLFIKRCIMNRKILSIILAVVMLLAFTSCSKEESDIAFKQTVVAVSSVSGNVQAAREFATSKGAECVTCSTDTDAVVAVLNGKADYVVLDEYSGYLFQKENDALSFSEKCEYSIEYRACFTYDNADLCNAFNEAFKVLKEKGTIDKIKTAVYNNEEYECSNSTGDKGTLVMACDPIFDNRVYINDYGEITGLDIYIAKEVCSYLGYNLVIKTVAFEEMFGTLNDEGADFLMGGIEKTEQRAEHYLFSDVYSTYSYNAYKIK